METKLIIEILGKGELFTPQSARGCTQTLMPLPQGNLRRTINGKLVWIGSRTHRKFQSIISCKDQAPPAFDGLWRGDQVKVTCLETLTQTIPKNCQTLTLEREPASLHLLDLKGQRWEAPINQHIKLPPGFQGGFLIYAPRLFMMVENYTLDMDEWGLAVGWTLELAEV